MQNLLCGVCVSPFILPMIGGAPAGAESVSRSVSVGENGKDAEQLTWFRSVAATKAKPGGNLTIVNTFTAGGANGTAVEIGSIGGRGGSGFREVFLTGGEAAMPGASGGRVIVTQEGALDGKGDQAAPTSLLLVYSRGGASGNHLTAVPRGGDGGEVSLVVNKNVRAVGTNYAAVWAQSLGGSSGTREGSITEELRNRSPGGSGGDVAVTVGSDAIIATKGSNAPAIIAESLGGAGSKRSYSTTWAAPYVTNGGEGGAVTFLNRGTITVAGPSSPAVLLQSIGGQGGEQHQLSDGGQPGGMGGGSGKVTGTNDGRIATVGDYSFGIVAQSVGGSGGRGGPGFFGGGDGGKAGGADEVTVTNQGEISTRGLGAHGIVAQSVGGGNAINAFAVTAIKPGPLSGAGGGSGGSSLFIGKGGNGGTGGDGAKVTVAQGGTITTSGESAYGILAQSIGGGGGRGGSSDSFNVFAGVAIGGAGGGGGNGGDVFVTPAPLPGSSLSAGSSLRPLVSTEGKLSSAIVAQSIGGGGGAGGTASAQSAGIVASISVAVGGSGGKGGDGGHVSVVNTSDVSTASIEAFGIQAKSIGGGGGAAGNAKAYALAIAPPETPGLGVSFSVGGSGGEGGSGKSVSVTNLSTVTTKGEKGYGIQAMSIGGGGGNSGTAASTVDLMGFYLNFGLAVSIGGSNGGGGNGGAVTVVNEGAKDKDGAFTSGVIETHGGFATGIMAQSIGGGGGDGGAASASAASGLSWNETIGEITKSALPLASSVTGKYEIGGKGGKGGDGRSVSAANEGLILTRGDNARGIFAQSLGGGGGDGGGYQASGKADAPAAIKQGTASGKLDVGGKGGGGGSGGSVSVNNSAGAVIETHGSGSAGIVAQSIGGGGGSGGAFGGKKKSAVEWDDNPPKFIHQLTEELLKSDQVLVFLFGDKDKKEKVEQYKFLDKNAPVQKKLALAKDILSALKVLTDKDKSWASRIGQSVGTLAGGVVLTKFKDLVKKEYAGKKIEKVPEVELTVAVGGAGGKGGKGRDVTVWNEGSVITHADNSWALFAQSVGGGGGAAGAGLSTGNNKVNLNLSIGGSGGDGGDGGSVEIAQRGTIATSGAGAFGVLAQSVGGGGGIGGVATSANTVSLSGNIKVGGSGGKPSSGGRVAVDNSGTITTQGRDAHALVAQSVGGGGGVSFVTRVDPADPTVLAKSTNEKEALEAAFGFLKNIGMIEGGSILDKSTSIMAMPSLTIGFGGSGGGGGDGGDVTVTHSGEIITRGPGAFGIFAQSVGGGGGFGVDASKIGYVEAGLSLGGGNGVGGKGGNIQVNLERKSSITTSGEGATAIFLQSIGGGGGYGGTGTFKMPFNMPLVRDEATSGNAGRWIRLEMDKDDPSSTIAITTNGSRAHGIQAQSIGGGGGTVFDVNGKAFTTPASGQSRRRAMGEGGGIFASTRGSIEVSGAGSYGFYGQSGVQLTDGTLDPSRKGNAISFHHDGKLVGGAGTGAAIRIDGGNNDNEVVVKANSRVSAISGTAILGSFGRETVLNDGTIVGDLDLVHGNPAAIEENRFFNRALGTYQTGPKGSVNVGTMGFFLNDGAFDVGGTGLIAASTLTGHFDQRATGTLVVDVTSSPPAGRERSDLLTITGATRLGGRVMAHVVGDLRPETFTVLSAKSDFSSTATGAGNPAAPFTWEAGVRGKTVTVTPSASFGVPAGASTTSSERNAMEYLQRIWTSGAMTDADARRFGDFARVASVQDYLSAVDKYSPEESASTTTMQALAARDSMHFALSCPVFAGTGTLMEETSCAWARMIGNWTHQNSSEDGAGYRRDSVTLRAGLQREIAPDWFLGATAGFTQSSLADSDGFSNTEGNAGDLAISLKRQVGPWLLAASGHVGYGRYETQRILGLGSSTGTSQGTSSVMTASGRFRASYEFTFPTWYVKPYADVDVIHTSLPGHTESGLGGSLAFSSAQQWNVAVSPNIEFGARLDVAPDMWLRPYASVGMTVVAKDSLPVKLRFSDTNAAVSPFVADVAIPDILGNLTVGAQLFNTKGYEIKAEYRADFGRDYLSQEVSARLAIPF